MISLRHYKICMEKGGSDNAFLLTLFGFLFIVFGFVIMGLASEIGPIDAQLAGPGPGGATFQTSAQSFIDEFDRIKKEVDVLVNYLLHTFLCSKESILDS